MSRTAERASQVASASAASYLLERMREWWRRQNELSHLDRSELERIAGDLGVTVHDLEELVARGPHAADLLYERMAALGINRDDIDRAADGLMRDLEKNCAMCQDKGGCRKDLEQRPGDPVWQQYCPNALSLESVQRMAANRRDG